jgi:hypothetical protein
MCICVKIKGKRIFCSSVRSVSLVLQRSHAKLFKKASLQRLGCEDHASLYVQVYISTLSDHTYNKEFISYRTNISYIEL